LNNVSISVWNHSACEFSCVSQLGDDGEFAAFLATCSYSSAAHCCVCMCMEEEEVAGNLHTTSKQNPVWWRYLFCFSFKSPACLEAVPQSGMRWMSFIARSVEAMELSQDAAD
jgi:hypothetical protein